MNQSQLPSYKQEKSFIYYAPVIAKALNTHPYVFTHDPTRNPDPRTVETFASRFRYAIDSSIEFGYTWPTIERKKLVKLGKLIKCVIRDGFCLIGSKECIQQWDLQHKKENTTQIQPNESSQPEYEFRGTDVEITMLCRLIARKTMSPTPIFYIMNMQEKLRQDLETLDVLFDQDEKNPQKWRVI